MSIENNPESAPDPTTSETPITPAPSTNFWRALEARERRENRRGRKPGTYIDPITNTSKPIPGALRYENGQPVITPMPERKPRWEKLAPVNISSLIEEQKTKAPVNEEGPDAE